MKVTAIFLTLLLGLFFVVGCEAEEEALDTTEDILTEDVSQQEESEVQDETGDVFMKIFDIKSGIIEYEYSGTEVGTSIMYLDDYGSKSAMHKETKSGDEVKKTWSISLDDYQYVYDPDTTDNGVKMKNPMIEPLLQMDEPDYDKLLEEMYTEMGFVKAGTETFLGKECIVYESDMGKILTWKGLLILMEMDVGGMITKQEATSLKTDISVDKKHFELPANIEFSDMPAF